MCSSKHLKIFFGVIYMTRAIQSFSLSFSGETVSQYAPRNQQLQYRKLLQEKERRMKQSNHADTLHNSTGNSMSMRKRMSNVEALIINLPSMKQVRKKYRKMYYKNAPYFYKWASVIAWLVTILKMLYQRKHYSNLPWIAPAVSFGMRIYCPLKVVTYFISPLFMMISYFFEKNLVILICWTATFLLAVNVIIAATLITAVLVAALVKQLLCTSFLVDEWFMMALLSLSVITSWINGHILDNPIYWRNVETKPVSPQDLKAIRDLVKSRAPKYNMRILGAYKVNPHSCGKKFETCQKILNKKGHPSKPQQLFHGTSFMSARNIVAKGFKVGREGMYGGGVYFAKTPRKSMNYCRVHRNKGVMLLCDVLMGNSRILKIAKANLEPRKDLFKKRYHLFRWGPIFFTELVPRSYDSVTAIPSKLFPFLGVQTPEFVVYRKEHIRTRYVLIVKPPRRK
mmetsp:Transcript_12216/g.18740  ORF Transcript_12216/g.18740 Transcript_12216/m.18740 type:complete len:454 (-) Transcript_12216:1649-3010(-)